MDGGTLEIHDRPARLWGVNAPEARQTCTGALGEVYRCGREAAMALDAHLADQVVRCWLVDEDPYGRMVGRCDVEGRDLGAWLVREGWALRYERYAGAAYAVEEWQARRDRAGIRGGTFEAPWDWRRERRHGR